jgi:hypothetical protein
MINEPDANVQRLNTPISFTVTALACVIIIEALRGATNQRFSVDQINEVMAVIEREANAQLAQLTPKAEPDPADAPVPPDPDGDQLGEDAPAPKPIKKPFRGNIKLSEVAE